MKIRVALHLTAFVCATISMSSDIATADDNTCSYDWSTLTCKPTSKCSLQYKTEDASPSQACRVTGSGDHTKVPQQLHLAFAGKEPGTGMAISWASFAQADQPAVWIGTTAAGMTQVKDAKIKITSYYSDKDYSLFHYHAVVSGLKPYTEYYYKVGSATDTMSQSAVTTFRTARAAGDPSQFVVAVYGDMGTEANSIATNKYINTLNGKVDFIYHLGDVSYADNYYLSLRTAFGFYFEDVWNRFMNSLTNVMRHMAYMVVVGNHEAECHSPTCIASDSKKNQLGNYSAFTNRFRMPSPESGGAANMWYSFDYATVHFTTISTETDFPNAPKNAYFTGRKYGNFGNQLAWLEADLKAANANRAKVPWIVVGMHRSVYTVASCDRIGTDNDPCNSLSVKNAFEGLFIKYKVDLVYEGHVHAYERLYPTADNTVYMDGVSSDGKTYTNPKAPVHVIAGMAGNSEGLTTYDKPPTSKWLAFLDNKHYGITKLSVTPTSLTVTMIEAATEKVYDEFSIIKKASV